VKLSKGGLPCHSPGGGQLSIADDTVDLWLAFDEQFQSPEVQAGFSALLTPLDADRRQRLHFESARRQFSVTRAMQRQVLSGYVAGVSPAQWQFQSSAEGRPKLAPPFDRTGLHFNLAHTEGVVAMAVCRHACVGVDVEKLGRAPLAVADRYFSAAETAQLRALPVDAQPRRFVQLWTLKEAYLKAIGTGLAGGLGRMSFVFGPAEDFRFERADDADAARWQFSRFEIGVQHLLALAVLPRGGARLSVTLREFRARESSEEERAQP
jgi:4'-phosphopantetheinyl transferase